MALTRMILIMFLSLVLGGNAFAGKALPPAKGKTETKTPAKQTAPCGTGKVPCQCSIC